MAGGVVAVAIVVVAALAFSGSGGKGSSTSAAPAPSGVDSFAENDRRHVTSHVQYDHTPPAGGNHSPVWLNCGVYDAPVPNENAVHSLEHGAVWIAYRPSLPPSEVGTLRSLVQSKYDGTERYVILSPYPDLPSPIVATAWGNQLERDSASDPSLVQFIDHFREGPQDLEPGSKCSGGVGSPVG